MYSEYVFDLYQDDNGEMRKRKPGRRGPLSTSTRQGIEDVKLEGGACWRCKILKKPVSTTGYSIVTLDSLLTLHI
jgi:hypothetical protein